MYGIIIVILLIWVFLFIQRKTQCRHENFGYNQKPFEQDNATPMNNPFDNIDYIRPEYRR